MNLIALLGYSLPKETSILGTLSISAVLTIHYSSVRGYKLSASCVALLASFSLMKMNL